MVLLAEPGGSTLESIYRLQSTNMLPQNDPITAAVLQLAEKLPHVSVERVAVERARAAARLASELRADRDSPPLNVSAMDGYAVRLADCAASESLPVAATATAGRPAPPLPPGRRRTDLYRAPVPLEADCVIPREMTRSKHRSACS